MAKPNKARLIIYLFFIFFFLLSPRAYSYEMSDYASSPVFTSETVVPNILVVLDYSGSMTFPAYGDDCTYYGCQNVTNYDASTTYYGYFETDAYYQYASEKFFINSACTDSDKIGSSSSCISGNLLNFATMSRLDLLRKALIGGKAVPRTGTPNTLIAEGPQDVNSIRDWDIDVPNLKCTFTVDASHRLDVTNYDGGTCPIGTFSDRTLDITFSTGEARGIVQNLMDRDGDDMVDENAPRFGVMIFKDDDKGVMRVGIDGSSFESFVTAVENEIPEGGTPTTEALYEAIDYFTQINTYGFERNDSFLAGPGGSKDPMYNQGPPQVPIPCRKNFTLLISDGEYTASSAGDPVVPAKLAWQNDIRTDEYMDGKQNIETYTVFAFGAGDGGRNSLRQIAMFGGYDDYDSNNWPYNQTGYPGDSRTVSLPASPCLSGSTDSKCNEWDKDSDGIPDNYYEADSGNELEDKIMQAITDLLDSVSSGTTISVLSTSYRGSGNVYQSYFLPSRLIDRRQLSWTGQIIAMGIDEKGNLIDDNGDTISFTFNEDLGATYVNTKNDGDVKIQDWTGYKWAAGEEIKDTLAANRSIISFIDSDNDGIADTDESVIFSTSNLAQLSPYLDPDSDFTATEIINFVSGVPVSGCRERTYDALPEESSGAGEWKLGDIVNATPVLVGQPAEDYHILYSDATYGAFFSQHASRDKVLYAGANDGMLHAIDVETGNEKWAYIPYNLLPHLKWLAKSTYDHTYYVDLTPKIVDINFSNMGTNGWKTVLIGGMRFGGGEVSVTADFDGNGSATRKFASAYFAIDITDPDNPHLLWEFKHDNLGFTASQPGVAKVGDKWYMIVGSGPKASYTPNYDGESSQPGKIFILDITNSSAWIENTNYWIKDTGTSDAFLGSPTVFDIDSASNNLVAGGSPTYNSEVAYIGETYYSTRDGFWQGNMYRLVMDGDPNPANWTLTKILDGSGFDFATPVTTAPSVSLDDGGNIWVHFGTGRFLASVDKADTKQHGFFAIRDARYDNGAWKPCWDTTTGWNDSESYCSGTYNISDTTKLYDPSEVDYVLDSTDTVYFTDNTTKPWVTFVSDLMKDENVRGWYRTFTAGDSSAGSGAERSVTKPIVVSNLALFTTILPDSGICSYGGSSSIYSLYYKTGTPYAEDSIGVTDDKVDYKDDIGAGFAADISLHVGQDKATALIQTSTGEIKQINVELNIKKSGVRSWNMED